MRQQRTDAQRIRSVTFSRPFAGAAARLLGILGLGLSSLLSPAQASESDFPQRPISLVVPFAAGGTLDASARVIGEHLQATLGQPVLVNNRPGAGSSVGARFVAGSPADGYTLFFTSSSAFGFLSLIQPNLDLRLKDFAPLGGVVGISSIVAVNPKLPANDLKGLVALAGQNKAGINFCSTGIGGLNHLQLEMFRDLARQRANGTPPNFVHVPYNGLAPALTALRAGDVDACVLPYSGQVKNLHDNGDLRVIAVQRNERLSGMPDVPTTGEQGFAAMDGNDLVATISAPAGTPKGVQEKLEAALAKAMNDPAIVKRLNDLDAQPMWLNAADTKAWLEADVEKYSRIIKQSGLEVTQ